MQHDIPDRRVPLLGGHDYCVGVGRFEAAGCVGWLLSKRGRLEIALVWSAPSISISVVLCYPPSSLCLLLSCNSNLRHLYDLDVASAVKPQPTNQTNKQTNSSTGKLPLTF